ncbi:unnamed protein product, partial [Gadus morhua 'NCC']
RCWWRRRERWCGGCSLPERTSSTRWPSCTRRSWSWRTACQSWSSRGRCRTLLATPTARSGRSVSVAPSWGRSRLAKNYQNLRTKLLQQTAHLEELERRKEELGDLRRQNQELGVRLGTLVHTEGGLQASNQRLKDAQDVLREDRGKKSDHYGLSVLEERQVQWLEEKHGLQAEQDLLQHKYGQAKERLHRAAGAQKKRKAQTENKEKRLHNKIHQLEARIAELELESSTAKRRPSHSEEQTNLNRRLKELQRRHSEFRHLLLGHQAPTGTGPAFLPSSLFAPPPSAQVTEEHHLREVSQLYGRLEELESVQLHQLEELGAPAQRDQAVSGQC